MNERGQEAAQNIPEQLSVDLVTASAMTGLSVPFLRSEIREGRLPCLRVGRRVLLQPQALRGWLEGHSSR